MNGDDARLDCSDVEQAQDSYVRAIAKLTRRKHQLQEMVEKLLLHCHDPECLTCGEIVCPHGEPLHFHHDGCPACTKEAHELLCDTAKAEKDNCDVPQ